MIYRLSFSVTEFSVGNLTLLASIDQLDIFVPMMVAGLQHGSRNCRHY